MSIKRILFSRFLLGILTVFVVMCVSFTLLRLMPGDPVMAYLGETSASPEYIAFLRQKWGLDKSLPEQLYIYLERVFLHGDFGYSAHFNMPVMTVILQKIPVTIILMVTSLFAGTLIGILSGLIAAKYRNALIDGIVTFFWSPRILHTHILGWINAFACLFGRHGAFSNVWNGNVGRGFTLLD